MSDERDFKEMKAMSRKKKQSENRNMVGRNTPTDASEPKTTEEKHEGEIDKTWQRKVRLARNT